MIRSPKNRSSKAIAAATLAVLLAAPAPAFAQLDISRDLVVLDPSSAEGRSMVITVRNSSASALTATTSLRPQDDARGAVACDHRLRLSPSALRLAPGETGVVNVTFAPAVASSASAPSTSAQLPRECAAAAVIATNSLQSVVPVFVTPPGLAKDGELDALALDGDSLVATYRNTGGVHTPVVGELQVRDVNDELVALVPLASGVVAAGSVKQFRVPVPRMTRGKYTLYAVVDFGGSALTVVEAPFEVR